VATILLEGFDEFGPPQITAGAQAQTNIISLISQAGWSYIDTESSYASIAPGLNGAPGYCIAVNPTTYVISGIQKALPQSYGRLIGGVRVCPNIGRDNGVVFYDGTTAQCSIIIQNTTGTVAICQGADGTVLQSSNFVIGNNSVHYIEWDISFNTSENYGGWTVWVDGAQVLSGTGTTQQSANASADNIGLASFSNKGGTLGVGYCLFDDLYVFDNTTAYNNAPVLASPVIITQGPAEDYQTQWNNQGSLIGNYYPQLNNESYLTIQGNRIYVVPVTSPVVQALVAVVIDTIAASTGANVMPLVFADSSGSPGALLSSGPQVTGVSSGTNSFALSSQIELAVGTQYWLGFMTDTSIFLQQFASGVNLGFRANYTYSGGAPSTCPSGTAGQASAVVYGACKYASTDFESLALNPPQGDASYTSTGLTGPADVFFFPPLPLGVTDVFTVGIAGNAAIQSSADLIFSMFAIPPNGTSGFGTKYDFEANTSYAWYDTFFDSEPGTSGSWSVEDVDRAIYGMLTNS